MPSEDLNTETIEPVQNELFEHNEENGEENETKTATSFQSESAEFKTEATTEENSETNILAPESLPELEQVTEADAGDEKTEQTPKRQVLEEGEAEGQEPKSETQEQEPTVVEKETGEATDEQIQDNQNIPEKEEEGKLAKDRSSTDKFEEMLKDEEQSENSFNLSVEEPEEKSKEKKKKKKKKIKSKKMDEKVSTPTTSTMTTLVESELDEQTIDDDFLSITSVPLGMETETVVEQEEEEEEEEEREEKTERQEEEEKEEKEKLSEFQRCVYYEQYDEISKQYDEQKVRNNYFVSKLVKYYEKRKMFHVLYEGKEQLDALKKYEKQLDHFESLINETSQEITNLKYEIEELKKKCGTKKQEAELSFEMLQHNESELGNEVTSSEEKSYEEKIIDRYLKHQRLQLSNLRKIRLDYIKIRNRVTETQEALDAIDNLGSHLHLIDYEQLKHDNRNLHDKLEEKDLEITQVRKRCQHAVQMLAHRRETVAALDEDMFRLNERYETVSGDHEYVREEVNSSKQLKEYYRNSIQKMKKESGLLSKPKLLRDMCETIKESEDLAKRLQEAKKEYMETADKAKKIGNNITSQVKINLIKKKMKAKEFPDDADDVVSTEVIVTFPLVSHAPMNNVSEVSNCVKSVSVKKIKYT